MALLATKASLGPAGRIPIVLVRLMLHVCLPPPTVRIDVSSKMDIDLC